MWGLSFEVKLLKAPFVAVPVATLAPLSRAITTHWDVCVVVDSTLAALLRVLSSCRPMRALHVWRDTDELGQHLSFSRQCLYALSGVLYFLIQTPSMESSGPLVQWTSVFPNDSVTEPCSLTSVLGQGRTTASPPYLRSFLACFSALDCSTVVICCYDFWTCSADGVRAWTKIPQNYKEENPRVSLLTVHRWEQWQCPGWL